MNLTEAPQPVRAVFRGKLDLELSLVDLIQIACLSSRSGKLLLRTRDRVGTIFIRTGRIIAAETGDRRGEEALFDMAIWAEGEFLFAGTDLPAEDEIATDTNMLLIEAARIHDEASKAGLHSTMVREMLPDLDTHTDLSPIQRAYADFLHEKEVYESAHPEAGTRRKPSGTGRETPWFGIVFIVLMLATGLGVTLYLLFSP